MFFEICYSQTQSKNTNSSFIGNKGEVRTFQFENVLIIQLKKKLEQEALLKK